MGASLGLTVGRRFLSLCPSTCSWHHTHHVLTYLQLWMEFHSASTPSLTCAQTWWYVTLAHTVQLPFGSLIVISLFLTQALNSPLKDIHIKSVQDIENEVKYQFTLGLSVTSCESLPNISAPSVLPLFVQYNYTFVVEESAAKRIRPTVSAGGAPSTHWWLIIRSSSGKEKCLSPSPFTCQYIKLALPHFYSQALHFYNLPKTYLVELLLCDLNLRLRCLLLYKFNLWRWHKIKDVIKRNHCRMAEKGCSLLLDIFTPKVALTGVI